MFSSDEVLLRLKELGVEMIKVDMTNNDQVLTRDLSRAERKNIPVNLIYPADYPARPAILLEELFGPAQALQTLDRVAPEKEPELANPEQTGMLSYQAQAQAVITD